MTHQVIYFSRKGSTKTIADAIASTLNIQAEDVKQTTLHNDAFVFLGSGCYGGKPGKKLTKFIENNDFTGIQVAVFGTSGGGEGKETEFMQQQLKDKGATVKGSFFCKGKFWFSNKERPSDKDIQEAQTFAQNMIQN